MSEPETVPSRRFQWPAEYYSGPTPVAVLPKGVTFGCGAASLLALLVVFGGGIYLARGGIVDVMDMTFGMSMGELRGMYTKDVTPAQKAGFEAAIETLRQGVREEKIPIASLDPVLKTMRNAMADGKIDPHEVQALTTDAQRAAKNVRATNTSKR